jgi:RNA polymerase sigma-70 factor (ECF subfamily)
MDDDSAEDGILARRIGAAREPGGDPAAEAVLCRRLYPRLRAYGLRHLRDPAAAADLAQHVLVVVLEALRGGRVTEPDRLSAFVMGACRNTSIEWKKVDRRRGRLLETFGPTLAATVAELQPTALDRGKLVHCLEELASRERAIVTLTYFSEKDAVEIARELSMSVGNVRVARHRAIAHLHDCVTKGEPT